MFRLTLAIGIVITISFIVWFTRSQIREFIKNFNNYNQNKQNNDEQS